jgi:ATP-dependent DNA ligase
MNDAIPLDLEPMLAKAVDTVPEGPGYLYEPKWDGFRCIVHRTADGVELVSRTGKPLGRYFPEMVASGLEVLPPGVVLDGELVVPVKDRLDWDALSARVHPAASRVALLAAQTPATYVAFDLLAVGGTSLLAAAFEERRSALQRLWSGLDHVQWRMTASTDDPEVAAEWFRAFEGAGLDGVVAKPLAAPYAPGKRTMLKVKHKRTADVVVTGYRWHKNSTPELPLVGALQLSLYDGDSLIPVGGSSAFSQERRAALVDELSDLVDGTMQGEMNRWNARKDTSWVRLRPERVAEVSYDQLEQRRFRHTVQFLRWRPDRDPDSCRFDQLDVPVRYSLDAVMQS